MASNREILVALQLQGEDVLESMRELRRLLIDIEQINRNRLGFQQASSASRAAAQQASREFSTLRNVVNQVFNTIRNVGNAMQSLSKIGLGGLVSTFESTLISRATGLFTSQLDNAIERFDIMKTFPLTMQQFGVSINASSAAIKKMNEAVIGLPTSLSEIVELSQRFVSVMPAMGLHGDELMSKASDFAIAINNAFLAGGNTSQQAYFAMMQLQDLFTKGELIEREWKSLSTGLQGAGLKIAEYFNYENFLQLAEAIDAGNVSLEQFVDGIIELGTSGGVLDKMARIYQTRLSSVFANIGNAFQRLIAGTMVEDEEGNYTFSGGILGTLDSLIANRYADNENINDLASYIRETLIPRIDELSKVAETWIIDHEDEIFDFLDRLINYDWEGLTAKIADLLSLKWGVLIDLFTKLPTGFLAFTSTLMGPIGQAISTFANILQPLVMAELWGFKSPGSLFKRIFSPSGADGWASSMSVPLPGEAAGTTALGGLGKFGLGALGAYVLLEQAYLWSKAGKNTGGAFHRSTLDYINEGRKSLEETDRRYDTISSYAYYLPKMTDAETIRSTIEYLNEALPGINLRWDEINKKVTVNGDLIDNLPEYIDAYIAKLREADKVTEATMRRQELSEKVTEARSTRDSARAALEEGLTKFGFNPADFFDENGNILASAFSDAAQSLNALDGMELANLRSQFELARADVLALEKEWRAYDNMIKMSGEEWPALVDEFRHKYGEIPEEVMEMIEDGTVTIPTSMEELIALCAKAVEEGRLPEAFLTELGIAESYISNDSAGISAAAGTLGANAGESMGSNLFSHVQWWLNSIQGAISSVKFDKNPPSGGFDKNPSGGKNTSGLIGRAFGGRIYRQGGTDKDTVLTWLQPGEYVLRKKAADKLGGDILNKLNNFNFKGAVRALSERVGAGMSPYAYAGATGNTRIYNNNAQATINVNNATQEFTQRRASKWVRGLK